MISVTGLRVTYFNTGKQAVDGLSLAVKPGERLVLLGPSGCGKSTVLKAILGLLRPEEARVEGVIEKGRCRLSSVFQSPALFPWLNVRKNIVFPLLAAGRRDADAGGALTDPLLKMCGLQDCGHYLPHQLSAGMQQRVSFLRALANSPDLVVMDEPFSSLDPASKRQLMDDFLAILARRGITVLFVTHDIREALAVGGRILMLTGSPAREKKQYTVEGLSPLRKEELTLSLAAEYEN